MSSLNDDIDNMKISFQDGVDTLYDTCVSCGSTPTDKTPTAISEAIEDIYNTRYNEGYEDGEIAAEPEITSFTAAGATTISITSKYADYKNLVLWKNLFVKFNRISGGQYFPNAGNWQNTSGTFGIAYNAESGVITLSDTINTCDTSEITCYVLT